MRNERRLLLSGDGTSDSPEVIWLQGTDPLPDIELPPVVLGRELLDKRPAPRPWDQEPDKWHKRFKGAQWIWTTSKFYEPQNPRSESLTVRRTISLPTGAVNASASVVACACGGLHIYVDGKMVGRPQDEPQGADNFYGQFERKDKIGSGKAEHVWEFVLKRTVMRPQDKNALPVGGLIYALDITWQEETKADVVKRLVDAWFGGVTSRFFRIFGFLGFLGFLFLSLSPRFDATTRTVCGGMAVGFLGAWLSPLIRTEAEREGKKGKQQ